jgi:hypothetical protein
MFGFKSREGCLKQNMFRERGRGRGGEASFGNWRPPGFGNWTSRIWKLDSRIWKLDSRIWKLGARIWKPGTHTHIKPIK